MGLVYPPAAHMDVSDYVLSAGRAVLDMVEREWQPLSPGELELRLDQAVEEILESELMAKVKTQPPPTNTINVQLLQSPANVGPDVLHAGTKSSSPPEEDMSESEQLLDSAAVKVINCCVSSQSKFTNLSKGDEISLFHSRAQVFFLVLVE